MGEVTLGEHINDLGQRVIYVFDFFSERSFFMEVIDATDDSSPRPTPFIAGGKGDPPRQINLDLLDTETPTPDPDPGFEEFSGLDEDDGLEEMDLWEEDPEE
jgi:hypothetical protein